MLLQKNDLISIADSIRTKTNSEEGLTFPDGFIEVIDEMSGGSSGSSGNMAIVPELNTLSRETVNNSWGGSAEDIIIDFNYMGIDETNTIALMQASGKTGTIQYIPNSYINVVAQTTENGEYPMINNIVATDVDYFVYYSIMGSDNNDIMINGNILNNSQHLTLTCLIPSDW